MSEWDDYNETLTQVLAWLLQAETQLKQQEPVSDVVDLVKEQFREHEVRNLCFEIAHFYKLGANGTSMPASLGKSSSLNAALVRYLDAILNLLWSFFTLFRLHALHTVMSANKKLMICNSS